MILNEDMQVTLTFGELCRIVNESAAMADGGVECDESVQGVILASILASLFAVGSIVRADNIRKTVPPKASQEQIQTALDKAESRTYGGFSAAQATNAVMRTIYLEGKGETSEGRRMIATVIWNRAGGDVNKLAEVCLKPSQFSIWNGLSKFQRKPAGFIMKVPPSVTKNANNKAIWDECKGLVEELFSGKFNATENFNAYMNKDTADKSAVDTWGTTMSGQKKIGNHTFGYLKDQDGFRKNRANMANAEKTNQSKTRTYTVKDTDNGVSFIARDLIKAGEYKGISVMALTNKILAINAFKKDKHGNPLIKAGQKINLPPA